MGLLDASRELRGPLGGLVGLLGNFWEPFGGFLKAILQQSWGTRGLIGVLGSQKAGKPKSWTNLRNIDVFGFFGHFVMPSGAFFGCLRWLLGCFGAILGPSWGHLGGTLSHLGAVLGPSGGHVEPSGLARRRPGTVLAASRPVWRPSWASLGPSWEAPESRPSIAESRPGAVSGGRKNKSPHPRGGPFFCIG